MTAKEYGVCVLEARGIRPVVTQADDKVAWDGYSHVGVKMKPPRARRRAGA